MAICRKDLKRRNKGRKCFKSLTQNNSCPAGTGKMWRCEKSEERTDRIWYKKGYEEEKSLNVVIFSLMDYKSFQNQLTMNKKRKCL